MQSTLIEVTAFISRWLESSEGLGPTGGMCENCDGLASDSLSHDRVCHAEHDCAHPRRPWSLFPGDRIRPVSANAVPESTDATLSNPVDGWGTSGWDSYRWRSLYTRNRRGADTRDANRPVTDILRDSGQLPLFRSHQMSVKKGDSFLTTGLPIRYPLGHPSNACVGPRVSHTPAKEIADKFGCACSANR